MWHSINYLDLCRALSNDWRLLQHGARGHRYYPDGLLYRGSRYIYTYSNVDVRIWALCMHISNLPNWHRGEKSFLNISAYIVTLDKPYPLEVHRFELHATPLEAANYPHLSPNMSKNPNSVHKCYNWHYFDRNDWLHVFEPIQYIYWHKHRMF